MCAAGPPNAVNPSRVNAFATSATLPSSGTLLVYGLPTLAEPRGVTWFAKMDEMVADTESSVEEQPSKGPAIFGIGLLGLSLLSLVATYFDWPDLYSPWVILVGCSSPILVPVGIGAIFKAGRGRRSALVIAVVAVCIAELIQVEFAPIVFRLNLARQTRHADPLIAAIKRVEAENGTPPDYLAELTPKYINPTKSGFDADFSEFRYQRFTAKDGSRFWWDLGSTKGLGPTEAANFQEGKPDHAILIVGCGGNRLVIGAKVDRLPLSTRKAHYSAEIWNVHPDKRMSMVQSFLDQKRLEGKAILDVLEILGPPSGQHPWLDTPWRLELSEESSIFDYHWVYYEPAEHYPGSEHIGRWAYESW